MQRKEKQRAGAEQRPEPEAP
uniref:Uncharacterized protein n=1 Tax=Arundo donax TaxID=35708 RepID=A0A0A9BV42_ARUDO